MRTLFLDPGAIMGWALFDDDKLLTAGVIRDWKDHGFTVDKCVIEIPQIRLRGGGKGDPNQLVKMTWNAGQWVGRNVQAQLKFGVPDIEEVYPTTWKGDVPKSIMLDRIRSKLNPDELRKLPNLSSTAAHNMVDAIGIGLWKNGRLS
jgi:hypothetical protein